MLGVPARTHRSKALGVKKAASQSNGYNLKSSSVLAHCRKLRKYDKPQKKSGIWTSLSFWSISFIFMKYIYAHIHTHMYEVCRY